MLAEFRRLKDGVTPDEIDRVKAGLKSSLIMRQESTSARAGAMAAVARDGAREDGGVYPPGRGLSSRFPAAPDA